MCQKSRDWAETLLMSETEGGSKTNDLYFIVFRNARYQIGLINQVETKVLEQLLGKVSA